MSRKPSRVYALRESENSPIMYVGCTEKSLEKRFKDHLGEARLGRNQHLVYLWLRSVNCNFIISEIAVTNGGCSDLYRRTGLVIEAALTAAAARRTLVMDQRFITNCQGNPFRLKTGEINEDQAEAYLTERCGKRRAAKMLATAIASDIRPTASEVTP